MVAPLPSDHPDHAPDKWAAGAAAAALVEPDMLLGLGTGSTVAAFLDALDHRRRDATLGRLAGVPTSEATASRCRELGIDVLSTADVTSLDLVVDGADELTSALVLTKGGGAALLREKVVASMADAFVVIAGADKLVSRLGATFPLPVEVVPFALAPVRRALEDHGAVVLRQDHDGDTVVTDNGNVLLDLRVPGGITDPVRLSSQLSAIPGIAEHGLFIDLATRAVLATRTGELTWMTRA